MRAKLSTKSQIVIPAAIRRQLGLEPGDYLDLVIEGERIVARKEPDAYLEQLKSLSGPAWNGAGAELERTRDEWERR